MNFSPSREDHIVCRDVVCTYIRILCSSSSSSFFFLCDCMYTPPPASPRRRAPYLSSPAASSFCFCLWRQAGLFCFCFVSCLCGPSQRCRDAVFFFFLRLLLRFVMLLSALLPTRSVTHLYTFRHTRDALFNDSLLYNIFVFLFALLAFRFPDATAASCPGGTLRVSPRASALWLRQQRTLRTTKGELTIASTHTRLPQTRRKMR